MKNIRDFYRPADSGSRRSYKRRGGLKFFIGILIIALVGFAWVKPEVAGKLVGRTIQTTAGVLGQWLPTADDTVEDETTTGAAEGDSDLMALPVSGVVVRNFVAVDDSGVARYDGVDIKSQPGQDVQAAAAGTVVQITEVDEEWLIIVQHAAGLETRYGGLAEADVKVGDKLALGEKLGKAGDSPVYFAIYQDGEALDPLSYLQNADPSA